MKKVNLIVFVIVLISVVSFGQGKMKFGHIDKQLLVTLMPERTAAEKAFLEYTTQLEDQLAEMQKEIEAKYATYEQQKNTYTELIRQTKEDEIRGMQERIQSFQVTANQDLAKKEEELMQPIVDKANEIIAEVGKELGLFYVFDTSFGAIVYFSNESIDILPKVKEKLGIKDTE